MSFCANWLGKANKRPGCCCINTFMYPSITWNNIHILAMINYNTNQNARVFIAVTHIPGLEYKSSNDFSCFPIAVNKKPVWTTVGVLMGGNSVTQNCQPVQKGKERQIFMKFSKVPYVLSLPDHLAICQEPVLTGRSSPMWCCHLKWSSRWTPSDLLSL